MGEIRDPLPVKLFVGVLTSLVDIAPKAENLLVDFFGAVDLRSGLFPFDMTRYYDKEMGTPIYRYFLSFERLIEPSTIADAKMRTNGLERAFADERSNPERPINLDPGYLEQSKIVLASTKNFSHRILISGGIYAEVTLHFQEGAWHSFPWTFPDYKTDRYHAFFTALRDLYRNQLSRMGVRIRRRAES
ncbi:MAG: DUF4416 family protein [Acidobacteria bacterium]|nr:DUF4416 family protein [Acidobacteriota bacterium]